MLLSYNVPDKKLEWFKNKGIIVKKCEKIPLKKKYKVSEFRFTRFCKYYLFTEEMKKWKNIIFLEGDVIVRASLDKLTKLQGFHVAQDWSPYLYYHFKRPDELETEDEKRLYTELRKDSNLKSRRHLNAGVMILSTDIIEKDTFDRLIRLTNEYYPILREDLADQPIFNLFFYNKWMNLPLVYNCFSDLYYPTSPAKLKTIVVHTAEQAKAWLEKSDFYEEWKENFKKAELIDLSKGQKPKKVWNEKEIIFNCLFIRFVNKIGRIRKGLYFAAVYLPRHLIKIINLVTFLKCAFALFVYLMLELKGKRGVHREIPAEKKYIVILGGFLDNKGSQAMLYTTVDQLKKIFPKYKIVVLAIKFKNENYTFDIKQYSRQVQNRILTDNYNHKETNEIVNILKESRFIVDISGYMLTAERTWYSDTYLNNIIVAKKFSVPFYILPQSIGPFNYNTLNKMSVFPLLNLCLKYPTLIFAREKDGVKEVKRFSEKNVRLSYDIVLQNKKYDLKKVFNEVEVKKIKIQPNSVGVVPNLRVLERMEKEEFHKIYQNLIELLRKNNKTVYILRHSPEDLEVCRELKEFFKNHDNVKLLIDDLSPMELEYILSQFDFVIASRYHSVIHSYRQGVPALVIGWSIKYFELLKNFDQLDYYFNCRSKIKMDKLINSLIKMMECYKSERKRIVDKVNEIQKEKSVFEMIK
jgi:colanic acid/amylovoran biosynthesis protein